MRKAEMRAITGRKVFVERHIKLPNGRHSDITVVSRRGKKFVFKASSRGKGLSFAQASALADGVKRYNALLKRAGVNVSEILMVSPVSERPGANTFFVASLERFVNRRNASEIIASDSPRRAIGVFVKVMQQVYKAVSFEPISPNKASVLIDSKPKNYVLGKNGEVYYIDFYTPKLLGPNGEFFPYISNLHSRTRKELQTRFQDKRAVFQIMLAQSVADRPELRKEFENEVLAFLEQKGERRVVSYLKRVIARDYRVTNLVKEEDLRPILRRSR